MRSFSIFASVVSISSLGLLGCATGVADPGAAGGDGGVKVQAEPPHAEGNIILGESHNTTGGNATPIVSVSFVPDTSKAKSCATDLGGACTVIKAPKCATTCASGEACGWGDDCTPTCKRVCTKSCATDEECYFPSEGADPACRTRESFDSGPVAFAGTSVPITLYPPYKYTGPTTGAPFLEGAEITVQASGAMNAGFPKWEQKISATTFLQTGLEKLTPSQVFGTDPLTVTWSAGSDDVTITLSGAGGVATCKATDSAGSFDVPRKVITEALGTSSTLSVSVSRQKLDVQKGIATKGELSNTTMQKEGWVKVRTSSTESKSYVGCTGGLSMCNGKCTDTSTDANNCGKCGNACGGSSCSGGTCGGSGQTCDQCYTAAQTGTCKSQFTACANSSACVNLTNCIGNCNGDSTCIQNCGSTYSSGVAAYNARAACICDTACTTECAAECK